VVGRDRDKLEQFVQGAFADDVSIHPWSELETLLPQSQLVANTTPIGMYPQIAHSPLSRAELERLPVNAIVYDLIYTPRPTLLLQQATDRGLVAIDGLEMLIQQGAAALACWLRQSAPVEVMRKALLEHLSSY
jgi:shikimate dehydrogenase